MKLARYVGDGRIEIRDEPAPVCPLGGLVVKTSASGLCSGELMAWYMDQKIPHVLGHEVSGKVIESQDYRFSVGSQVFSHHHAPCLICEFCRKGLYVHCAQWKKTKLTPGGMAEFFAVAAENLNDTHLVNDLRAVDAALIEPLACVAKSIRLGNPEGRTSAVIGLGAMGLMHLLILDRNAVGYETTKSRRDWAASLDLQIKSPDEVVPAEVIFVCPGSPQAVNQAIAMAPPGGHIVLFAPMPPGGPSPIDLNAAYFKDLSFVNSYSCGPDDTAQAIEWIRAGKLRAEQVVSDFTGIDDLPRAYLAMKAGDILKAMVVFE